MRGENYLSPASFWFHKHITFKETSNFSCMLHHIAQVQHEGQLQAATILSSTQPHMRKSHPIISLSPPIHSCIHNSDLIKHVVVKGPSRDPVRGKRKIKSCRKIRKRIHKKARVSVHPATIQTITSITFGPLWCGVFFFPLFLSIEGRSITFRFIGGTMQEGNRSVDQERLW